MAEDKAVPGVPKIYAALCRAIKLIGEGGLEKKNWNEQQKYWFRGIDDIYNTLNPILAKFGIVIVPSVDETRPASTPAPRGRSSRTPSSRSATRSSAPRTESVVDAEFIGEALDTGDKAVPKALSMAYKSMAIELFCIPVEIDDDADAQPSGAESEEPNGKPSIERPKAVEKPAEKPAEKAKPEPMMSGKPITAGQAAWITKRVQDTGADLEKILAACGVKTVAEIDGSFFANIRHSLAAA